MSHKCAGIRKKRGVPNLLKRVGNGAMVERTTGTGREENRRLGGAEADKWGWTNQGGTKVECAWEVQGEKGKQYLGCVGGTGRVWVSGELDDLRDAY